LLDGAGGFAVFLGKSDGRGAALGDVEAVASGEDGSLKGEAGVFGEVGLFGGGGVDAPEVGGFPGEEGGGEKGAAILDGDAGSDGPRGDEFSVAGDKPVGGGRAFLPKGFSAEGVSAVDEAIVRAKPDFFFDNGGREADGGVREMEPLFFAGFCVEAVDGVVG